jgi:hypothetical protein
MNKVIRGALLAPAQNPCVKIRNRIYEPVYSSSVIEKIGAVLPEFMTCETLRVVNTVADSRDECTRNFSFVLRP